MLMLLLVLLLIFSGFILFIHDQITPFSCAISNGDAKRIRPQVRAQRPWLSLFSCDGRVVVADLVFTYPLDCLFASR